MTVAGGGRSGKSTLVKVLTSTIQQIFQCNDSVLVAAPTGSASFNGGGVTMHRLFGIPVRKVSDKIGSDKMRRLKKTLKNVVMLVFDERSMISAEDMGMIETYEKQVAHQVMHKNSFFGNISVILLVGDDYQLPPIMPGASANKANPKPSYVSAFVMGIVKKGLNAFNKLGEKLSSSKHPKDYSAIKIC